VINIAGLPAVSAAGDVIALATLDEQGDACEAGAEFSLLRARDTHVIRTFRASARYDGADEIEWCKVDPAVTRAAARFTADANRVLTKDRFRSLRELPYADPDRVDAGQRVHADDASHRIVVTCDAGATLWSGPMPPLEGACADDKVERPSGLQSVHVDPSSDLVLIAYGWGFD
jgi:hypothetical protein